MPGLVPGFHVRDEGVSVDGRDKPGQDVLRAESALMTLQLNFNSAG
jgi:hypothetical protein